MTELQRARFSAFQGQGGRCFYCGYPMWLRFPEEVMQLRGYEAHQADRLQCTAEHQIQRRFGGTDGPDNVVAACLHCNQAREMNERWVNPRAYRDSVRAYVNYGAWHSFPNDVAKPSAKP